MPSVFRFPVPWILRLAVGLIAAGPSSLVASTERATPNFVVILTDDQGYGDLGVQGHPSLQTPRLDRMAAEGQRWTDFYAAASVCTASRAALLTGRWPVRSGMVSDKRLVLTARAAGGLPVEEVTLAEQLASAGYATGLIGKWHLGHQPQFMPWNQGFDVFEGTPYSNDEIVAKPWRSQIRRRDYWNSPLWYEPRSEYWDIPWMENQTVTERPVDQSTLTQRSTEAAVRFVRQQRSTPFFLFVAYHMPHVPLFASDAFRGRTTAGVYGDALAEVDWGVGEILDTLCQAGLAENTVVVFTSDNGPWTIFREHGGSAGLLRGDKGSTWEAGHRVPTIFWAPGRIPAGTIERGIGSNLDIFATFSALAGLPLPADRPMDSLDLSPALTGQGPSPRNQMLFFRGTKVLALRDGLYKAHFATEDGFGLDSQRSEHAEPLLFHLGRDPGERYDLSATHPEMTAKMRTLLVEATADLTYGEDQLVAQTAE